MFQAGEPQQRISIMTEPHEDVQNVLICMVMEEYNPPQCQDEVQGDKDKESDSWEPSRNQHNFITACVGYNEGQVRPVN